MRGGRLAGGKRGLMLIAAAVAAAGLAGCAAGPTKTAQTATKTEVEKTEVEAVAAAPVPPVRMLLPPAVTATPEERWGVKVDGIRLTAAGYMLDFRYRVLDPGKAAPVLNRRVKPYLVVGANGATLSVPNTPKLGLLRQISAGAHPDRMHFMLFANPGQMVQSGSKVTLVMGDLKVEDIVVQ